MKNKFVKRLLPLLVIACVLAIFIVSRTPRDGWQNTDGMTQYILDGRPVSGWQEIEGRTYYFNEDGMLCTGWLKTGTEVFYLASDGQLLTGWQKIDGITYYFGTDGARVNGWQDIDGSRYCFDDDGRMYIGIMIESGAAYLFNEQGQLSSGWVQLDGKTYYADENGHPLYVWNEIGGKRYYFDETGAAASGWVTLDGIRYYFYTDGAPAQGKLVIDGQVHYFAPNGQVFYLVNPWNYVPENYTVELTSIGDTHQIAACAYEDYLQMIADCQALGFSPIVCSSYRTHEYQEGLFRNRIDRYVDQGYSEEEATELAGQSVAVPGTSEHQLGLALDIVDSNNWRLDESQAKMPTQIWLMDNSWRYGWILRYPVDKSAITGIVYEPWHYRYVGREMAQQIHESGLCLEEYMDFLATSVG